MPNRRFKCAPAALCLLVAGLAGCTSGANITDKADVKPVQLFKVPQYTEGVVFDARGNGYVSQKTVVTKFTLDGKTETWATTGGPNGHRILGDGTHLLCDRSHRQVLHLSSDGKMLPPAAKAFEGKPLLGPNDLTLDPKNGGFYFTDPEGTGLENPTGSVYHVTKTDGTGELHRIDTGLAYPNGIVLSPDGKRLFVGETEKNRVLVYDVSGPGKVGARKVFAELPACDKTKGQIYAFPDGMCFDAAGNLYVAHFGMKQVQVLSQQGNLLRSLDAGNLTASNVAFGGPHMNQLSVTGALGDNQTTEGAVYRLDLGVKGHPILPKWVSK